MMPPAGDEVDITYEVKKAGDMLTIALLPPEGMGPADARFKFSDIHFEDGNLVFWWEPGPRIDCVLEPIDGGGYEGECIDPDGDTGILSMMPPATTPITARPTTATMMAMVTRARRTRTAASTTDRAPGGRE